MKKIIPSILIVVLFGLLAGCGNPNQRLDEYLFHDGSQIRLKVVRYYRNIPFNQLGEQAVVMCQSENTRDFPAHDQQDAGWRMLGAADAQGTESAAEAATRVKSDYEVIDGLTLIAKMNVFNISFDGCKSFINWDPGRLPQAMIDSVEKPDSCAPNGPADCRYLDFEGDRTPRYEGVHMAGKGEVAFTVASVSFKDIDLLRVQTSNNGAVWHVEMVSHAGDKQGLDPESVRALSMSLMDSGIGDISLVDWLEAALPARSMVIWPDVLATCGEQTSPEKCAHIRFNDAEENSGTIFIAMNAGKVSFHSGSYARGGSSREFVSPADLRESMATGAK